MSVVASSDSTLAVNGVRRVESRTTRIGDAPGTIRTVNCGSSCSSVRAPTRTASQPARIAWVTRRSGSPLIHLASPVEVAIRPSIVCESIVSVVRI